MMLLQLFLSFLQIGMFSVGGGYAAIPLIQNQTVDVHAWLSATEFMDLATIAEMTPGPIAVNAATFVGLKTAGLPGASPHLSLYQSSPTSIAGTGNSLFCRAFFPRSDRPSYP